MAGHLSPAGQRHSTAPQLAEREMKAGFEDRSPHDAAVRREAVLAKQVGKAGALSRIAWQRQLPEGLG